MGLQTDCSGGQRGFYFPFAWILDLVVSRLILCTSLERKYTEAGIRMHIQNYGESPSQRSLLKVLHFKSLSLMPNSYGNLACPVSAQRPCVHLRSQPAGEGWMVCGTSLNTACPIAPASTSPRTLPHPTPPPCKLHGKAGRVLNGREGAEESSCKECCPYKHS